MRSWAQLELARIVNRKKYWWRNKTLTFNSVPAQATYNLSDTGAGHTSAAPDFLQASTSLFEFANGDTQGELPFQGDKKAILKMRYSTAQGVPSVFTVEPGTTKVLRLSPVPVDVRTYTGMYYAGVSINWSSPEETDVPLLPLEFHYVLLLSMQRRAFFYLYGQKDARFANAVQDELLGIKDLDEYRAPSTLHNVELRSSDTSAFVQSTR